MARFILDACNGVGPFDGRHHKDTSLGEHGPRNIHDDATAWVDT